ncbi:MAG: efflux RND transporter periplasmic adaptor subunit [Chitinophagales bacterium]
MNKIYFILIITLFFQACQHSDEPQETTAIAENTAESEEENAPLLVKDVLAANSSVKIGGLQIKVIQQDVSCTGRIEVPPTELMSVHSKSEGFIEHLQYLPGDYVKKGALLFTIVNPNLIEKQRILLETKAELILAQKDFERKRLLQSENATPQKTFDETLSRKDFLTAKYKGLRSELELLGIGVDALEQNQAFQSKISIYANQSGYVHEVFVNKGQMIQPQDRLMEISNNDHIHLELQVLSKDVPLLKKGQKVLFSLPDSPKQFEAEIVKLNPMIDEETGTLKVHCHIEKGQGEIAKAGMFVNAEIEVAPHEVVGLPLEAVVKEGNDYYAYLIEGDLFKKRLLEEVQVNSDFVTFKELNSQEMVVAGAYYLE